MMNRYEMIYIIDTGLEEAARKEHGASAAWPMRSTTRPKAGTCW